jgi:hypothetical protein
MKFLDLICLNKHYLIFILSSCLLSIGSEFNYITVSTLIDKQTGMIGFLVYYVMWCVIPVLVSFVSGSAIDYFDKKKIITISLFLNSIIISGYVFAHKYQSTELFYTTSCLFFLVDSIAGNSMLSYIVEIVSKDDLSYANSINAIMSRVMSIIGVSLGGIVLYYMKMGVNLYVTIGIFFVCGFIFSAVFCISKKTEIISNDVLDNEIVISTSLLPLPPINDNILLLNNEKTFWGMIKEGYIYLIKNKNILYITIYKAISNILLSSLVIINYYFAYKKFSNDILEAIKLFTICNSIEVIFVLITQIISQRYIDGDIYKMKKMVQYAYIPFILSTLCYAFSYNYYIWWLGNAIFGCGSIIFSVSTNTILQIETRKDILGRIFTYGYNLRIFMCAIGAIYTTLFIKYEILCIRDFMLIFAGFYFVIMIFYALHYLKYYS